MYEYEACYIITLCFWKLPIWGFVELRVYENYEYCSWYAVINDVNDEYCSWYAVLNDVNDEYYSWYAVINDLNVQYSLMCGCYHHSIYISHASPLISMILRAELNLAKKNPKPTNLWSSIYVTSFQSDSILGKTSKTFVIA